MAETFFYLTTTGHRTGKSHHIEIWYVEYLNCYYLCSEHREKAHWVQNVQKNPDVTFHIGERDQPAQPRSGNAYVVEDAAEISEVMKLFAAKYDWNDGLFVAICPADL